MLNFVDLIMEIGTLLKFQEISIRYYDRFNNKSKKRVG